MTGENYVRRAIIPGSYDPVTLGHADLFRRAALLFDEVYAVVCCNTEKSDAGMFSPEQRLRLLSETAAGIVNVRVDICTGLLADYMHAHSINVLVKGVRGTVDFDYESGLAAIMRAFDDNFETILLPADPKYAHISSTYARDLIKYNCRIESALPLETVDSVRKMKF